MKGAILGAIFIVIITALCVLGGYLGAKSNRDYEKELQTSMQCTSLYDCWRKDEYVASHITDEWHPFGVEPQVISPE